MDARPQESEPPRRSLLGNAIRWLPILAMVSAYGLCLGRYGLLEPDESRYAEVAREMLATGNYLTPMLNGFVHPQKPPGMYWATAACMAMFGTNETGARMAPLLFALGVLWLTARIGRVWLGGKAGRTAAFLLAGMVLFFALGRAVCPDMAMTFWSTASIACFAHAMNARRRRGLLLVGYFACAGVAFATKGPLGLLIPLLVGVAWQLTDRRERLAGPHVPWWPGILVTVLLALGWFVAICIRFPSLGTYYLHDELLGRFFTRMHGRSQPFWFFVPVLLVGCQPWTTFLPLAFARPLHAPGTHGSRASTNALAAWVLPSLLLISISGSKLMTYLLPLLPGLALWLAPRLLDHPTGRGLTRTAMAQTFLYALTGGAFIAVALYFGRSGPDAPVRLDWWFTPMFLTALMFAATAFWVLRYGMTETAIAWASVGAMTVYLALASQVGNLMPVLGTGASLKPLAEALRDEPGWESAQIIVAGTRRHGLAFYLHRVVDTTVGHADGLVAPDPTSGRRLHASMERLDLRDAPGHPAYLLIRDRDRAGRFLETEWTVIGRSGSLVLLRHNISAKSG